MAAELYTADPAEKADMLARLDEVRDMIERGEIVGFHLVGLMPGGAVLDSNSFFSAQAITLIGALHSAATTLAIKSNSANIASVLDGEQ